MSMMKLFLQAKFYILQEVGCCFENTCSGNSSSCQYCEVLNCSTTETGIIEVT